MEDPFQNPQSFKRFYYENILDLSSIFQNPNFLSKLNEFLSLEVVQEESQQIQEELDFRQNQDAISALLGNLKEMVGKSELNLKKIIQGIMGVRSQYRKMKGLKDNHELLKENPNVQIIFLELEEKLLNVGLINLEEINSNGCYYHYYIILINIILFNRNYNTRPKQRIISSYRNIPGIYPKELPRKFNFPSFNKRNQ